MREVASPLEASPQGEPLPEEARPAEPQEQEKRSLLGLALAEARLQEREAQGEQAASA